MTTILKNGIHITKNHPKIDKIKSDLTRVIRDINDVKKTVYFYFETKDSIILPRFYPLEEEIQDDRPNGLDIDIESTIIPTSRGQELGIEFLSTKDRGILKLETGRGKTVVSIAAISKLKKKALIIVHKKDLIENWISEFLKHTNIEKKDIGVLKSTNFNKTLEKPIVITTVQTLSSSFKRNNTPFLDKFYNSNFGICIGDECHILVGPEQFSKAFLALNIKRIFGISATPYRLFDETTDIIKYHLGDITYFEMEYGEIMSPQIYAIKFDHDVYRPNRRYINWGGKFHINFYWRCLRKSNKFKKVVLNYLIKAYKSDRTILVLCSDINTLLDIAKDSKLPKEDVGFFIPTLYTKDKKRHVARKKQAKKISSMDDIMNEFLNKRVVFATYMAAKEGSNKPSIDCLIMLNSTTNVEQAIGRALRKKENKKMPIVIDFIDTGGPKIKTIENGYISRFVRSYYYRKELYDKKGWVVIEKEIDNNINRS